MVDTRWCIKHKTHHTVGSEPYQECFPTSSKVRKPKESKKPKKTKKAPIVFDAGIYISSFSKESVLKCRLKRAAPDSVTVRGNFYATGMRTFHRNDEPFLVTLGEFNSVLNRGERLFKLIT